MTTDNRSEIVSLPIAIRSDDATIEGYLSIPVTGTPCPGILVLSERYGLVEYIKDVTRRLARRGYVALAPEARSRRGFNEILPDTHDMVSVKECSDAIQYLNTSGLVKDGQIGVVGFCWGGHIAGMLACLDPLYAEIDTHPTLEEVGELEQAFKRHNKDFEFKIYWGAKHGFHNDEMPERYDAKAAEDAWEKTLVFLERLLRG
jgi:carboxymethylenebutenolidase